LLKTVTILIFCGASLSFFYERYQADTLKNLPMTSLSAGYVLGILAFSFTQSLHVHEVLAHRPPADAPFKLPLFFSLFLVPLSF